MQDEDLKKMILDDPFLKEIGLDEVSEEEINQLIMDYKRRKMYRKNGKTNLKQKLWQQSIYSIEDIEGIPLVDEVIQNSNLPEEDDMEEGQNATVTILVNPDKLEAKIRLNPPGEGGKNLTEKEIFDEIYKLGIQKGIHNKYVTRLAQYPVYGVNFQIAIGVAPVHGEEGKLIYHFENEDLIQMSTENESIVDFKNLGKINQVEKDDILCEIIPPTKGKDGYDIFGNVLHGKDGKPVPPPKGKNTYLSEDGLKLYANVKGHASMKYGKISVWETMTVDNVDYSTGNIVFPGDVTIKGDVKSGFTIRVGGSIVVMGNVEDNVILEAENDIVLRKGVNGRNGHISSNGDFRAGYIQYANVKVKNNIFADSIINSNIECGGNMTLSGEKGRVVGGITKINKNLYANEVGNSANMLTTIELIGPYSLSVEKTELEEKITKAEEAIKRLDQLILNISKDKRTSNTAENRKNILKSMLSKKQLQGEITKLMTQANLVSSLIDGQQVGTIQVSGNLYQNVLINLDGIAYKNDMTRNRCTVFKKGNKISFGNL